MTLMTTLQSHPAAPAGPIYVTAVDMKHLTALVEGHRLQGGQDANLDLLEEELDRALVMDADRGVPADVVTLDSSVIVVDLDSGGERRFSVVLPHKADVDTGRISVLAPLGMAVLGERSGATIEWDVPGGRRRLLVLRVIQPPRSEAAQRAAQPPAAQ